MSRREINPRVGNYNNAQQPDDNDLEAFMKRSPQTQEQTRYEKTSSGWEYSAWMIIIIGIVIVLLVLVIWFIFKKDETTELQRQIQPNPYQHAAARNQPKQDVKIDIKHPEQEDKSDKPDNAESSEEKLAREARDALNKKKFIKKEIGPVPGIMPDNPLVVGVKPDKVELVSNTPPQNHEPQPAQQSQPVQQSQPLLPSDNLSEINTPSVVTRMMSNFGLPSD